MESDDLDFKKDLNFLYKVNYGHSMIDISNVIKWYNRLDINIPLIMRDFALKNLDFANKKYSYFE
jgi:hypothetical protein